MEWLKIEREYLEKQAPLRAAWINGDEEAGRQLKALIQETLDKHAQGEDDFSPIQAASTAKEAPTKNTATILDFKIYKPVRADALAQAHVATEAEFAVFFATMIANATGCTIVGTYENDECVHLHTDEANMVAVSDALEARGLSHRF